LSKFKIAYFLPFIILKTTVHLGITYILTDEGFVILIYSIGESILCGEIFFYHDLSPTLFYVLFNSYRLRFYYLH